MTERVSAAPAIAPDEDGKSVGFEWWNGEDTVWMDWNEDGSVSVYWRFGKEHKEQRFQPGDGYGMHEALSRAFQIVGI